MAKTETNDAKPPAEKPVSFNARAKTAGILDISPTGRVSVTPFQGEDCEAQAKAAASARAKRIGRDVQVFGPQACVMAPPPKAEAEEVQLSF